LWIAGPHVIAGVVGMLSQKRDRRTASIGTHQSADTHQSAGQGNFTSAWDPQKFDANTATEGADVL
jgi:hypothetical protein